MFVMAGMKCSKIYTTRVILKLPFKKKEMFVKINLKNNTITILKKIIFT